jgi:predicted aldo/keto reductase-like oxidoreductase
MIPLRNFGKTDVKISALGLGGHHLGAAKDEATAVEMVHRAMDGGITFYDNCWEYNRGKSEDWLGKGLRGMRDRLAMLNTGFPFDAVQMPLNPFDANFFSFEKKVLPVLNSRGIAPLGMKPIGGHGEPVQKGVFTAEELLRYAMSLPVATTISGVSELPILEQNLKIAQNFTPLSAAEMKALCDRAKPYAGDGHFELYKTSIKFDNPEARLAHDFPLDLSQAEVKQMVYATQNTGRPFPQVSE